MYREELSAPAIASLAKYVRRPRHDGDIVVESCRRGAQADMTPSWSSPTRHSPLCCHRGMFPRCGCARRCNCCYEKRVKSLRLARSGWQSPTGERRCRSIASTSHEHACVARAAARTHTQLIRKPASVGLDRANLAPRYTMSWRGFVVQAERHFSRAHLNNKLGSSNHEKLLRLHADSVLSWSPGDHVHFLNGGHPNHDTGIVIRARAAALRKVSTICC